MRAMITTVLLLGAVYRLTRLLVADELPLVRVPRERVADWLDPQAGRRAPWGGFGRSVAYLMGCPWCMSVWVAAVVVPAAGHWVDVPAPWLLWPAASAVTGLVASAESGYEQRHQLRERQLAAGGPPR